MGYSREREQKRHWAAPRGPRGPMHASFRAHPALAGHILCLWTMRAPQAVAEPLTIRVLPDGCMDLIFDLGGCLPGRRPLEAFVTGTASAPESLSLSGSIDVLGVRFRPGGAGPFLGLQALELAETFAQIEDMGAPAHDLGPLAEALALTPDTGQRIRLLQEVLLHHLSRAVEPDQRVRGGLALLARRNGNIPVGPLADHLGLGRRTLERVFREHVGTSPKTMARILRLRRAIELARSTTLAASVIALEAGYFDQAHYSREFKRMTGATPQEFLAEAGHDAFIQYELPALA